MYRQAQALVGEARTAFPTMGAAASASRSGTGAHNCSTSSSSFGQTGSINKYSVSLDATWESDLWGSVRRQVAEQKAGQQGAAADLANVRLSTQATLAQTYFNLRSLDPQQKLLDDTVAAYQQSLTLTQNQYAQGIVARSAVIQAQTQLQSAQASAINKGVARAQYKYAIAMLVGETASTFSIPAIPLDATSPPVPAQLPSAILERRPDIASAERKAANEQIGVEIAAYFPTITLSAQDGFQSSIFSQLLRAPSRFWTLEPSRAAYDQDVATYRQTVLTAFQDVEDNLAPLRILEREIVVQEQAVASAQQALAIVNN